MDKNRAQSLSIPSTFKRLWAYGIDQIVILLLFFPLWGFWYEVMSAEDVVFVPLKIFIFFLLFPMLYEFIFLALFQQTPGKWVMGLWVVPQSQPEAPLQWYQAFLRALTARFSLFFSWAPFVLAFFKYDRTHLCDWVAETRVLQEGRRLRPTKIRWILGSIGIFLYVSQGFEQAIYTWDSIDWASQRVDLQEASGGSLWENVDFVFPEDED